MKNLSFDHVHYRSSNLDSCRKFYVDIMGGIELPSLVIGGNTNLQISLGGIVLLFIASKEPIPKAVPASDRLGAYHIAFLVDNCREATDYYCARGAKLAVDVKVYSDTITASFLTAPDGMTIELKEITTPPKA